MKFQCPLRKILILLVISEAEEPGHLEKYSIFSILIHDLTVSFSFSQFTGMIDIDYSSEATALRYVYICACVHKTKNNCIFLFHVPVLLNNFFPGY